MHVDYWNKELTVPHVVATAAYKVAHVPLQTAMFCMVSCAVQSELVRAVVAAVHACWLLLPSQIAAVGFGCKK